MSWLNNCQESLSSLSKAFFYLLYTGIFVNLSSCGNGSVHTDSNEVVVDVDQRIEIEIDTTRLIPLETNSLSLLYNVKGLEIVDDNFYVSSVDMLKVFDGSGNFIREISGKGQGPEEYLELKQVATSGDTILIFDNMSPKIMKFAADGTFISSMRIPKESALRGRKPNFVVFGDYGDYRLVRNGWTDHTSESNPMFSVYSSDWDYVGDLSEREMRNGEYFTDMFAVDSERKIVYYWEVTNDTVFVLNSEGIYPKFVLDFGSHKVPSDVMEMNSTYERLIALSKRGKINEYVSNPRSFQIYGKYLFFTVSSFGEEVYLCVLDTESLDAKVIDLLSADGRYTLNPIIALDNDTLYLNLTDNKDIEANPLLYPIAVQSII